MKYLFLFIILMTAASNIHAQTYNIILGRPTDNAITASVLSEQHIDLYLEYGTTSGTYPNTTTQITNITGTPDEIDMTGLAADTKYYYRLRYRNTGSGTFLASPEYSFHTQRAVGSSFIFDIESDEHMYDKKGVVNMYNVTLANEAADHPDFLLSLGDTYGNDHIADSITDAQSQELHKYYRPFLGSICNSIPYYFCLGNHEGEFDYYLLQNPPNNIAVYGTLWRKFYYPCPYPNNFYGGNTDMEGFSMGNPENYYSWTWGNALFVVMDVYRYQNDTSVKPKNWNWTLGFPQYTWLKNTLQQSNAKYKFVFAHHVSGQGRGGVEQAPYYEWGGLDGNGNYLFPTKRPGWDMPIQKLFDTTNVTIFFQGHDHLFAHEVLDSVVYQEVPMPSDSTYEIGMLANADAYVSDTISGTGHIRVTVKPTCVTVDFVRAWLPTDTLSGVHHNGEVAFTYTIGDCSLAVPDIIAKEPEIKVYPNPAKDNLNIVLPENLKDYQISLLNPLGQTILTTRSARIDLRGIPDGMYLIRVVSENFTLNKKVVVRK